MYYYPEVQSLSVTIYTIPGPNNVAALMKNGIAGGWDYALKNIELIAKLNPSTNFEVVFAHALEFGEVPKMPKFSNVNFHIYLVSKTKLGLVFQDQPSSQHGGLLNYALHNHLLQTDFYAILDPDCFLLQKNVFDQMINHMRSHNLDILGVGYPSTLPKAYYWDFPTAYFQMMYSSSCPPIKLNFLPDESTFVMDVRQPGGAGVPSPGAIKTIFKLPKFLKFLILRFMHLLTTRNNAVTVFLRHLPLNRPYQGKDLFHDTGWFNRESLKHLRVEIIPHLISENKVSFHFDSKQYLLKNHDVRESGIDPAWHFLANGIYENRAFGKQPLWLLLLIKRLGRRSFDHLIYPATSLVGGKSILKSIAVPIKWGNMERAFEYHWNGQPFCLHLGHAGKTTKSEDMFKLDLLQNHLISKTGELNVK